MNTWCGRLVVLVISAFSVLPSAHLLAQPPELINYQGRLLNGTNLVNGNVGLSLRLFNVASGGASLYEDSNTVTVVDGLYATFIGDHPTNDAFVAALTNPAVWVEVALNGVPLAPRERLASVGYAMATRGLMVMTNESIVVNPEVNSIAGNSPYATLSGGQRHQIGSNAHDSVIGGGSNNVIDTGSHGALIAGGILHVIGTNSRFAAVGGGSANKIRPNSAFSYIGGGASNDITDNASFAVIGGGRNNSVGNNSSLAVIGGGSNNVIDTDSPGALIAGGIRHVIGASSRYAAVVGGSGNRIQPNSPFSYISGGSLNTISNNSSFSTIPGGQLNYIGSDSGFSTIGGGFVNRVGNGSMYASLAGGHVNYIRSASLYATIGGGASNDIADNASFAVIGGGLNNNVGNNSSLAVIAGGRDNGVGANATNAFAAGRRAQANHQGSFVWGDNRNADIVSTNDNSVTFRAYGGFRILTAAAAGAILPTGSGSWSSLSDVNAKENFRPVDGRAILDKLAALDVREWNYRTQDASIRHLGPTAQDFQAAFGLGESSTGISTVDADGVALAAIQALAKENEGLKEKVSGFGVQVSGLEEENRVLRERLEALERKLGM